MSARRRAAIALGLTLWVILAGCQTDRTVGQLRAVSLREPPTRLDVRFGEAVYRLQPEGETSFMLSSASFESLRDENVDNAQIMHISLLWQPKAGATPMDPTATNAAVRWVIVARGEVGIYAGAGFATISGSPGDDAISVTLRDTTVRQLDATAGFNDLLTPARLTGSFTATRNEAQARRLRLAASQFVTNVFGETKYVNADDRPVTNDRPIADRSIDEPM